MSWNHDLPKKEKKQFLSPKSLYSSLKSEQTQEEAQEKEFQSRSNNSQYQRDTKTANWEKPWTEMAFQERELMFAEHLL